MGKRIRKKSDYGILTSESTQLRVAAYCRVSKNACEQEESLELQIEHYTNLISNQPDWICAGIYADKGSGRNTKNRPAFIELMKQCRKKIDLILVKSISRFARNTLDALKAMRELQSMGIDIWFEAENLRLQEKGVRIVVEIYCALAQAESESRSQDIKWGLQRSYQDVDSKTSHFVCYGYRQDKDGHLVINEEESKTVRLIFRLRAKGFSLRKISSELERRKVLSPTGKSRWSAETLAKLIANEKYRGDVLLQKTFVEDFFTGLQVKNIGQRTRYYIQNHHEAIIKRLILNKAQAKETE
jgi:DNA invertase Pin-like site-specific DNA recombinase